MKRTHQFLLLSLVFLAATGFQPTGLRDTNDPQLARFKVTAGTGSILKEIAEKFEIEHRDGAAFDVIVPAHRVNELYALTPDAKLLDEDVSAKIREDFYANRAAYHTFASVETHLKQLAAKYPQMVSLQVYGKSKEGRSLFALRIAANANQPAVMLTSATHGNELITVEVTFGLIDSLLAGYTTSPRAKKILDGHEIYYIPVVNPDGYVRQQRYANGVDPNREYPWPDKPNRTPNECIAAIMSFFHQHNIRGSIDFHSSGGLIMFPWAYTTDAPESQDNNAFAQLTKYMAQANGYRPGQISKILYAAPGSSADYYYWKNRTMALGVEIGNSNTPSASQIPANVQQNLESTLRFLETVRR